MKLIRLDKFLSDSGVASRSEAARLIRQGRVNIDGSIAESGAEKINADAVTVTVDGEPVVYKRFHYVMMNKPAGYVSSTSDRDGASVMELLNGVYARFGLFPAGRLDRDAEGFLILTDDGEFAHRITSPSWDVPKRYFVEIDGIIDSADVEAFARGIVLHDGIICRPALLETVPGDERAAFVTLREGKYHQVKRMIAACGKRVLRLRRVAVGGLALDGSLAPGEYRELTEREKGAILNVGRWPVFTSGDLIEVTKE